MAFLFSLHLWYFTGMKKYLYLLIAFVVFISLIFIIQHDGRLIKQNNSQSTSTATFENQNQKSTSSTPLSTSKSLSAPEVLKKMTLEEKIGQMFLVGFWGTKENQFIKTMIEKYHLGGVILLKYNLQNRYQSEGLIKNLQRSSAENKKYNLPLFIATDQEGGLVTKVKVQGIKEFTAQQNIQSTSTAFKVGQNRGEELTKLGINLNFSPVIDYTPSSQSFLYQRTFHGSPNQIIDLASYLIKGYQSQKLIATPKHFLGHPNNPVDPHHSITQANFTPSQIQERLNIFQQVIDKSNPGMIMISHVIYPKLDPDDPCSLSNVCIEQNLRQKLHYQGVVITDDLLMGAIQKKYSNQIIPIKAIQAGSDILLYVGDFKKQEQAYQQVLQAVKNGQISKERINQSVLRIIKLKQQYLNHNQ